jgi:Tfp pilus assembly protein PilO
MGWLKVQGSDDLVRDTQTNAIINTNKSEYEAYIAKRERLRSNQDQIELHGTELNNIREDLDNIKQMLTALLNKTV